MLNQQILKDFVKKESIFLTSAQYSKEILKLKKKKVFIEQYSNKFGKPSISDIAKKLVDFLFDLNKFSDEKGLHELIKTIPFLNKEIKKTDSFDYLFEDSTDSLIISKDDLSKLDQEDFLNRKAKELTSKIISEKSQEIDEKIKDKIEEFESIPSLLDEKEFSEPSEDDQLVIKQTEWWQDLGLSRDPFPVQDGLSMFSKDLYDKIIYKNKLIQEYISKLNSNKEKILNKGILIIGDYAVGKTTFFDYLSYHLVKNKIIPIRLTFFHSNVEVFLYSAEFQTKLFNDLKKIYFNEFNIVYDINEPTIDNCKDLMNQISTKGWDFMIIIDDLHKHEGKEKIVLKFLSSLQMVKNDLIRSGLKVGFMVAGRSVWKTEMDKEGALSGFFDTEPEVIPEVSADSAYEVINNRLKTFSLHQNRTEFISKKAIEKIQIDLSKKNPYIHYRMFINSLIKKLRNKDFEILDHNFVNISQEELFEIKKNLRESGVYDKLNLLLKECDKESLKITFIQIISRIYTKEGISESDSNFKGKEYFFKKLLSKNILSKQKTSQNTFKWVFESKIELQFSELLVNYKYYPEEYLTAIFSIKKIEKQTNELTIYNEINDFANSITIKELQISKEQINLASKILETAISDEINSFDDKLFDKKTNEILKGLSFLSQTIFQIEEYPKIPITTLEIIELWNQYWWCPSSLAPLMNMVNSRESKSKERFGYVIVYANEVVKELFEHLKKLINSDEIEWYFKPNYFNLNQDEIKLFIRANEELKNIYSTHFDFVKLFVDRIESKLRLTIYNFLNVIYGPIEKRLEIVGELKEKLIKKNIIYDNPLFNEFINLNRGQYRKLILENKILTPQLFNRLFLTQNDKISMGNFFEIFSNKHLETSHNKNDIFSMSTNELYDFIMRAIGIYESINSFYFELLNEHFYYSIENQNCCCFFAIRGSKNKLNCRKICSSEKLKDRKQINKITITNIEIDEIYNILFSIIKDQEYILDLSDYNLINSLFRTDVGKFYSVISLFTKLKSKDKYKQLIITKHFGTNIKIKFKD
jgi:hypothetical protein